MKNDIRRESEIIDTLFSYRRVDELRDYLGNNPDIGIIQLNDSQGNTVLHQLAYEGYLQLIKVLVEEVRRFLHKKAVQKGVYYSKDDNKEITNWMNQKNNEGFTPLIYASYSGHFDIIRYLVEQFHVSEKLVTNTGLNPLHLAAQKNMVMPFLYFRGRIDLNEVDDLDSTPLHWAAYMNSENVVAYILSDSDFRGLNKKDKEGNTPLMLAVTYGNTRITRRLLIKGANRRIKNNDEKTPLQVARQSQFKTISKMLDEDFSIMDMIKFYCNVKIEYKPKKRTFTIPILFIISFIVNFGIINFFLQFTEQYYLVSSAVIMGVMIMLYLSLLYNTTSNEPREFSDFIDEYTEKNAKKLCFECRNVVPKRGYHCDICGVCIKQYDHHCTWINNCVGKSNISRFMFFLIFLFVCLGMIGLLSTLASISILLDEPLLYEKWFNLRYEYTNNLQKYCLLGVFLVNQITSIFVFPVFLLLLVQIKNLLMNKTTFQNLRGPTEEARQIKERMRKHNKVSLRNCRVMCADNRGSFTTNRTSFSNGQLITEKFLSGRTQD